MVCCYKLEHWTEPTIGEILDEITLPKAMSRRARVGMIKRIAFAFDDGEDEGEGNAEVTR